MNFKFYQVIESKKFENYVNLLYNGLCSNKICFTKRRKIVPPQRDVRKLTSLCFTYETSL